MTQIRDEDLTLGFATRAVHAGQHRHRDRHGIDGLVGGAIIGCLVVGSIVLAPAIVFGYAVSAAERDDRERGL